MVEVQVGATQAVGQHAPVAVDVHPGHGLIHGHFEMLGVSEAPRNELEKVLTSLRAVTQCVRNEGPCGASGTIVDTAPM